MNLDIELSTRCRLSCPKCIRTRLVERKELEIYDFPVDQFRKICESKKYRSMFFGGTYGDCIYHPDFYELVKIAKENNIFIQIHTNGSGKSLDWWKSIFLLMTKNDALNIAMDGFKETAGIYRVNFTEKDFYKNLEIFKLAKIRGIECVWTFIPMKFNEHQIDDAKKLAKELGITFLLKKSERWYKKDDPMLPSNPELIATHARNRLKI
jgi:MoaA/NifB/PqqE/SkfB family radical SAM enzyme